MTWIYQNFLRTWVYQNFLRTWIYQNWVKGNLEEENIIFMFMLKTLCLLPSRHLPSQS